MKYKKITDVSNRAIRKIVNDIVFPISIKSIERNIEEDCVYIIIETDWEYYDDDDEKIYYIDTERITLRDPWAYCVGIETDGHYCFNDKEILQYKQWCMAQGVCELYLNNNPYLKRNKYENVQQKKIQKDI